MCDNVLEDHRDLLLLSDKDENTHYVCIRDFNLIIRSQITKHTESIIVCKTCFTHFTQKADRHGLTGQQNLDKH